MIKALAKGLLKRIGKFIFGIGISLFILSFFVANMQVDGIDTTLKQTISEAIDTDPSIITGMTQPPVDVSTKTEAELQTLKTQLLDQVSVDKMPALQSLVDQLNGFKKYTNPFRTGGILLFLGGVVLILISRGFNILLSLKLIGKQGAISTIFSAVFYKIIPIIINNISKNLVSNGTAATGLLVQTLLDQIIGKAVQVAFNISIIGVVIFGAIFLVTLILKGKKKEK